MRARRIAAVVLVVLASVCGAGALVGGYARSALLDSDQFADRAVIALQQQPVRDLVAQKITDDAVLKAQRDLVGVRPLVQSAAGAIVSAGPFQSLFRRAVADLHRTVFTRNRDTTTLTVLDVGVLLRGALQRLSPSSAKLLPAGFDAKLEAGGKPAQRAEQVAEAVDDVAWLSWALAGATLLLFAAALVVAPDRRRALAQVGIGIAVAGALVVVAYQVARSNALGRFTVPEDRAAAGAVWDAFLQDLRTWALVALGAGTILAAAATAVVRPVEVEGPLRRAWEIVVTEPVTPGRRALRGLALVVAGVLIIVERAWLLDTALILVGVYVLYQGVAELLRLLADWRPELAAAPAAAGDAPLSVAVSAETPGALAPPAWVTGAAGDDAAAGQRRRRRTPGPALAIGVAVLLVAALGAGLWLSGGTEASTTAGEITACNGNIALCDRPVNEVAFAGTHNAMSSPTYPNFLFAQQENGIGAQLDAGIHALLIDAHYGERVGSSVRTDLDLRKERKALVDELGEPAVASALRIRDRLVGGKAKAGPRNEYLCHGFCELGAIEMKAGLTEVRNFLVSHPNEVLIIVIQDETVTPTDVAKMFDESGLRPYVYTGPVGKPWPTLRSMIESGGRVIVMGENDAHDPAVPWYHDAYQLMQETPYHFSNPSQFSCAPNRGPSTASLFLLNHWIDTSPAPRPSNAAKVNAYDFLLARARQCESERGLMPNVIAVDFYETGDVFRVVDTLNHVPSSTR